MPQELFPHSQVRPSQKELKATVEAALQDGKHVVAHAPTGLGKTAATLPPALAYGLEHNKTTFFLTPRHSQHEIALDTLKQIKEKHNTRFVAVDLIGKSHLCEGANMPSHDDDDDQPKCPRYDNTYNDKRQLTDRARRKKNSLKGRILRAEEVKAECKKVCPYEILIHLAAEADVIVGDYFHIFHPGVRDVIFSKSSMSLKDCIVIVDEAHNLPDRTRRLYSAVLTEKMIKTAKKEAENEGYYEEEESLERLQRELERLAKHELGMDQEEVEIEKSAFTGRVKDIASYDNFIDDLGEVAKAVEEDGKESVCADIAEFLDRWKNGKEYGFVRVLKKVQYTKNPYLRLSYTCLNPQFATEQPFKKVHASIAMSGTLMPVGMYVDLFGLDPENTYAEAYTSPFPEGNKMNLIVDKVTTQYKQRGEKEYQKMAWYILKSAENVKGNVGVFFPSYKMRDEVYERLQKRIDKPVFVEDRSMDKEEKNKFLDKFAEKTGEGAVLLGVIGGSFGEGVDFPGELMSAVFIVGLPLQRPDLETQALIDFYDEKFDGRGWDYGYNYPAINRALQAAGRCIRSNDDRGIVMFMDKRYAWDKYRRALPAENYHITKAPWIDIQRFFS